MAFCPSVNFGNLGFGPSMEQRQKQLSPKVPSEKNILTIPQEEILDEILISILARLPVKPVARFRCVSRKWASILCRQDFTQLYMKMSLARPCLLFAVELNGMFAFFSAPQHISPENNSSPLVAGCHMSVPTEQSSYGISHPVRGWLCSRDKSPMICNPSIGYYINLPKVFSTFEPKVVTYLGYDPADKVFKVLRVSTGCRVLTLGTGQLSWRMVRCSVSHWPLPGGICINGVVYYLAVFGSRNGVILACFDVRSEKFKFLIHMENVTWESTLINFKGKLGIVRPDPIVFFNEATTSLEILVLDDLNGEKWSNHTYELPSVWKNLVARSWLYVVGMTGASDLVFSPFYPDVPYFILCYNLERNTLVKVEIQLGVYGDLKIHTFVDHVEDVNLMGLLGSP